jgi:predicted thioesterase
LIIYIEPKSIESVGSYKLDVVVTYPLVATFESAFSMEVVDPCLKDDLGWNIVGYSDGADE